MQLLKRQSAHTIDLFEPLIDLGSALLNEERPQHHDVRRLVMNIFNAVQDKVSSFRANVSSHATSLSATVHLKAAVGDLKRVRELGRANAHTSNRHEYALKLLAWAHTQLGRHSSAIQWYMPPCWQLRSNFHSWWCRSAFYNSFSNICWT